jgi:hypothetical protein
MTQAKIFISHISEEAQLASTIKSSLARDFLGLVDVFASSDTASIAAGSNWLAELEAALQDSKSLLVLCSKASLNRPWVNFEVGAAWIRNIPIIPVCHSGIGPRELPIPLSLLQGLSASDEAGLQRLYQHVATLLACAVPQGNLPALRAEIAAFEQAYSRKLDDEFKEKDRRDSMAKERVYEALKDPDHEWRTIERLAILGGVSEEDVLEMLVQDRTVRFGRRSRDGKRMAQLRKQQG